MILRLENVMHYYGSERVLTNISFGLQDGELVALLGPSGCGKTTITQTIAGHVQPSNGQVILRDRDVTRSPPESRNVGLVFQESTLFPHMTVSENVEYGLSARDLAQEEREAQVAEYLDLVDLDNQYDAYPAELSGGQRRRAELARALAPQPDVLLLDEPLSALDRALRERLGEEISRIQREIGVTMLFVTHDQEEAMALADRLIVMNDGKIIGSGPPRSLYESPPTPFVASFLGRSCEFSATVTESDPLSIKFGENEISVKSHKEYERGSTVCCHIRPNRLSLQTAGKGGSDPTVEGRVTQIVDIGKRYDVSVRTETGDDLLIEHFGQPPAVGEKVTVGIPKQQITVFDTGGSKCMTIISETAMDSS